MDYLFQSAVVLCTEPTCPVHHPRHRPQRVADDAKGKAEQEKQWKEAAIANTIDLRILAAIGAAVSVRLMKRDLLFVVGRLASLLDENRLAVIAHQQGIKKAKDSDSIGKLFAAYLRRAKESILAGLLVEITILHTAARLNTAQVPRDAATAYKVDTDAISLKVKQEFAAKEQVSAAKKEGAKVPTKPLKKSKAAYPPHFRLRESAVRQAPFLCPSFPPWALLLQDRSNYALPPDELERHFGLEIGVGPVLENHH